MEQYQESEFLDNAARWQKQYGKQEAAIIENAMRISELADKKMLEDGEFFEKSFIVEKPITPPDARQVYAPCA